MNASKPDILTICAGAKNDAACGDGECHCIHFFMGCRLGYLSTASGKKTQLLTTARGIWREVKEARMASGWANDDAVQQQIDSTIEDAISRARQDMTSGESLTHCEECGEAIPLARQKAVPGVRLCINCQQKADQEKQRFSGYNRRGSKDSQLR